MRELTTNVDWLAVIAGTVLSFLLGWLWYSPKLFGKAWAEGVGVELGSAAGVPVTAMVSQLAATFLLAWVIGVTAAQNALMTAILIVVALALFLVTSGLFAKKGCAAIAIEAGYIVAMAVVMIVAQVIL